MAAGASREADYGDILLAIVARLIATVKGCNESTCYLSIDPNKLPSNPGDHVYVVAPTSGTFRAGAYIGGGLNFLGTDGGFIVKIHCPSLIDQEHRDAAALTLEGLSIIRKASEVLAALSPAESSSTAWVPVKGDYDLTGPLQPIGYSFDKDPNDAVRAIELAFHCPFDWDTTRR
jgi:hypothetical protein